MGGSIENVIILIFFWNFFLLNIDFYGLFEMIFCDNDCFLNIVFIFVGSNYLYDGFNSVWG